MTYTRYKTRGEKTYAYDVTAYYDKELKRQRQKTKYIGVVTGKGVVRKRINSMPRTALDYGDVAVARKAASGVGIAGVLSDIYGTDTANTLLALACNKLIRETALNNFNIWYGGTDLKNALPVRNPSSQNLSRLMDGIGEDGTSLARLFDAWVGRVADKANIAYDLTSVSSSSEQINMLEYGNNRDRDDQPQVNLGLVSSLDARLPLYYRLFPGSITDVTTLKNTTAELAALNIKSARYILDRGFCSTVNIKGMCSSGFDFVMALSYSFGAANSIIAKNRLKASAPDRAVRFRGSIQYVSEGETTIGGEKLGYYHFFDEERRAREVHSFYSKLLRVESELDGRRLEKGDKPRALFEKAAGQSRKMFSWRVEDGVMRLKRKKKAISRRINRMGKLILIYTGTMNWETALSFYRDRDRIEKLFRAFKTDVGGVPLRVHKESTMRGSFLVSFVALIMYAELINRMRKSKLAEEYSVEGMFLELAKLKKIELIDGTQIVTECTKRCRAIIEGLGMEDMVPIK